MSWRQRIFRWTRRAVIAIAAVVMLSALTVDVAVRFWSFPTDELAPERGGPLVITDRHGAVLRKLPSPAGLPSREAWVALDQMPPRLVAAFLISEDSGFFDHEGVDWRGVVRAAMLNVSARRLAYGGSTITMQLVRMIRSPAAERTMRRKISEAVLAMRLERAMSKQQILEQYLNRAYFGNGAYGVEAAARLYFDKPARALSDGEATLLAVLPRAPNAYDPIAHPGAALRRREHVFTQLLESGRISAEEIDVARRSTPTPGLHRPPWRARHFTEYVLDTLPDSVRRAGGVVRTSIDLALQERLEAEVADHVAAHREANLDQAGLVVLDSASGEILAMVGSAGWDTTDGEINLVTRRRHPGSALKPFVYALALDGGDNPATITYDIADVPSQYEVIRATQKERGPVRYREALAGSYNLAAVHTLERVGVETLMSTLRRAQVAPLAGDVDSYGLRLALGSAKVRLLDLANGYRFLVRDGRVGSHRAVLDVERADGQHWAPARARETRVVTAEMAWLTMDMLSDADARRPAFGDELPIDLPFPVAVKTGTSRGFADTVTIAATREVIVAAWGGNAGGEPTQGLIAMRASAPLVRAGLLAVAGGGELTLPPRPASIVSADVCPLSGMPRGPHCPHGHREVFASGAAPTEPCSWHQAGGDVRYPSAISAWATRQRERGGRHVATVKTDVAQ